MGHEQGNDSPAEAAHSACASWKTVSVLRISMFAQMFWLRGAEFTVQGQNAPTCSKVIQVRTLQRANGAAAGADRAECTCSNGCGSARCRGTLAGLANTVRSHRVQTMPWSAKGQHMTS
jgi:hypothetical protein